MAAIALAVLGLGGCISFDEGETAEQKTLDVFEREAMPVFRKSCIQCHAGRDRTIGFLAGQTPTEIRHRILASGVVNLDQVQDSLLFYKGAHEGPAMYVDQAVALLDWIKAEQALRDMGL